MMIRFSFFDIDVGSAFCSIDIRLLIMDDSLLCFVVNKNARYSRKYIGRCNKGNNFLMAFVLHMYYGRSNLYCT